MAKTFGITADHIAAFNVPDESYPGYPGKVVRSEQHALSLEAMNWGFPLRLKSMKPTSRPKPVTNARDDKLHTPFWRSSFEARRCLIPATAWAEPEGAARQMTRTWYSLPGADVFAIGGIWRPTDEWDRTYAMVMVEANEQMAEVHDRMPVLLTPDTWEQWLEGAPAQAFELCRTWHGELAVERTADLWTKPAARPASLL